MLLKITVLHVYILSTTIQICTKGSFPKFRGLRVHIPSTTIHKQTHTHSHNSQCYMCTYPLQKHNHKHKGAFLICPFLIFTFPPQKQKQKHKAFFQNTLFYICTFPLKQHKHEQKVPLPKFPANICTYSLQEHKHKHSGFTQKFRV